MKRIVSGIMFTLLLTGMLTLVFSIQLVIASETIYIRADGSISPSTAPIATADNVAYTFTDNISDEIVVERNNIIIDGNGYMVQGKAWTGSVGISLPSVSNVTIKNVQVKAFWYGIYAYDSSNNSIVGNNIIANNYCGIELFYHSNYNSISGNNITANNDYGIIVQDSSNYNSIVGNNITASTYVDGIDLMGSSGNSIVGNNIAANKYYGILLVSLESFSNYNNITANNITNNKLGIEFYDRSNYNSVTTNNIANNEYGILFYRCSSNIVYHNKFVNNIHQFDIGPWIPGYANAWDDGYPSGGNYWSDYEERYPNATEIDESGIWDTPYIIGADNVDNYPLMNPYGTPPPTTYSLTIITTVRGTTDPASGTYSYTARSTVQVTAIPNANYLFDHWELNSINVGSTNPYSVLMNKNYTLKAIFSPIPKPPVGGYSFQTEGDIASAPPLTYYLSLIAIITTSFTIVKRKTTRKTK